MKSNVKVISARRLRIGIDSRPTEEGFKAHAGRGIGRYATEILKQFSLMKEEFSQRGLEILSLGSRDIGCSEWQESFLKMIPFGRQTVRNQLFLGQRLSRAKVDLVHFLSHGDSPSFYGPPSVVTVLDLIPLKFPDLYKANKPNWRYLLARDLEYRAIKRARFLLAISEHTKKDICELLGYPAQRIFVTHLAVDESFSPVSEASREVLRRKWQRRWAEALGVGESYPRILLYVGGIDPRKNISFLLDVLASLRDSGQGDIWLVVAGRIESDDQYPLLLRQIANLGLTRQVVITGYVSDEELREFYRLADIFVFPSLYEGFGLPPLEAMSSGCPVIVANNSCMPEVVGDCGMMMPDKDLDSWVRAIQSLLGDSARWSQYRENGLKRARIFSWERTARETMNAYLQKNL